MSRRARLFSEFLDESDVGKLTTAPTAVSSVNQDVFAKRRKTSGLNSRFDRMVETMNVTYRSPTKSARNRARSASSTSGSSVPRTPIDDYDEFHREGRPRLGSDFAVIKMPPSRKKSKKHTGVFPWDQDSSSDTPEAPPPPVPLPAWLAGTFSTLTTKHPLRLLLPRRTNTEPTPSPPRDAEDASRFSFCAPADPIDVSPPHTSNDAENAEPLTHSTQTPPRPTEPAFIHHPASLPNTSFGPIPPFSIPGPASSVISDSMPSVPLREPTYVECFSSIYPSGAPSFMPPPAAPSSTDNTRSSVLLPQIHSPEPTYANYAPSFMHPLNSTPKYSAEKARSPEDFSPDHQFPRVDDISPNHSAYMDLYSTPGPGYRTVPPVYFDSPTEDPSDSDPMEPVYEVDSLDFRWEPFIQKTAPLVAPTIVTDCYYEIRAEPDGEDDINGQLYASVNMGPTSAERDPSPGPFSFAPPADDLPTTTLPDTREKNQDVPATPERPPFFAPVPGIFISPLLGDAAPKTPPKQSTQDEDDDNALCSQASNDTIEDWDDTPAD
ncbi:hypothetical protein C8F04DRAFT_1388134 [Mycena alexandri]|uniref:Uncharacterized protein n=1 Tax=Mycena alexandri TaxID=1745969 RepID=A0AAD6THN0_9AGAR|nr:hypothetical protein C8F04DRAFT_1388134 [Mycena alexandri]